MVKTLVLSMEVMHSQIAAGYALTRSKLTQYWIFPLKLLSNHTLRDKIRTNRIKKLEMVI